MRIIAVAILVVVNILMLYLVVMNRTSEKVVGTAVSASLAALVSVLLVFVFGGEPPVKDRFPVSFIAFQDDQTPAYIPFRKYLEGYFLVAESQKSNPNPTKGRFSGSMMYHEFLQKAIIDSLASRFQAGWNVEVVGYKTSVDMSPTYRLPGEEELKLTTAQLEEKLQGNRFAKLHVVPPELYLPPESKLLIPRPARDGGERLRRINNSYVKLSIRTRYLGGGAGIGEQYGLMFDMPPNQDQRELETYSYEIYITADFSRVRGGHPDMPMYKKWDSRIESQLKEDFDEEQILANTKENYLFTKQAAQFRMKLDRIIRFSPPQRP